MHGILRFTAIPSTSEKNLDENENRVAGNVGRENVYSAADASNSRDIGKSDLAHPARIFKTLGFFERWWRKIFPFTWNPIVIKVYLSNLRTAKEFSRNSVSFY